MMRTSHAAIRYAGEERPAVKNIELHVKAGEFAPLWKIPYDARTGRYEVDVDGVRNAASFAVHRKLARVTHVELERTFYTNGDPIHCRVSIQNVSNRTLKDLRVEFAPFHYPWIAPAPDEPKIHPAVVSESLLLEPGESKQLPASQVATARGGDKPAVTGYVVSIWDKDRKYLYDLAFTQPIFLRPPNTEFPKTYPFLYLYPTLADVKERATAYRHFYPARYVSDVLRFDTSHTMFPSGSEPEFRFTIDLAAPPNATLRTRVLDGSAHILREAKPAFTRGLTQTRTGTLPDGLYVYEVAVLSSAGDVIASSRIEFALNKLPKSLLIFGAHQDDDTAHPALIRAAVENNIPIHFVYLTNGDAGGCDRFYMSTCDASRAMDFGETRMAETLASLTHLGVAPQNVLFLGLPDGGLEEIWLNHRTATNPYLSVLLASDHAPYKGIARPNLPFAREPVIDVIKDYIRKYQPDVIVTGHPEERHVDHRANNWLVVRAMQELLRDRAISSATRVLVDQSYGGTSWIHSPYNFQEHVFHVPGEVARLGQEALWFYQSQDGNHQLGALATYDRLPRTEAYPHLWLTDWIEHAGWNETALSAQK